MHRIRGFLALLIAVALVPVAARAGGPLDATDSSQVNPRAYSVGDDSPGGADARAVTGEWEGVMEWPDKSVHAILLHTGKVLWYRGEGVNGSYSYTWDPMTNQIQQQYIGFGIFCSGNSIMPDGRVLATGGRIGFTGTLGPRYSLFFDPISEQWSEGPAMRKGRYYPTNTLLGDGRTLVFSGYDSTHTFVEEIESFTPGTGPGGTDRWEVLPLTHYTAYYPRMHLLPNGKVFHTGKDPKAETLDPATGVWKTVATSNFGQRREGTSVQIPPSLNKFMIMGGDTGTNTTEIIDLDAPTPTWTYGPSMHYGRSFLNSVILPDGKILVSGGSQDGLYVLPSEIYDPETNTWTLVAAMHRNRLYHSSGLLLPDGRALWCGADSNRTGETYSPPYLFKGPRPVISTAPSSVQYGQTFRIQTPDAANIGSVVFMKPGAATHSFDMDQRYVPLTYTVPVAGALDIQVPTNPNAVPPGYYMLFILDRSKVPSVSKFIHVGPDIIPVTNRPPTVFAGPDLSVTPPDVATLNGVVADDGLPSPPGTCTKVWRKVSGPGPVTFADSLAAHTTATFSVPGTYRLSLAAFDGALTVGDTTSITVGGCTTTLDRLVAASRDDGEENAAGSMFLTGTDLELVFDADLQTVGMRFTGVDIPQGATIVNAYLQFTADEIQSELTSLTIKGQAADTAGTFTFTAGNISTRPRTTASVSWSPNPWQYIGESAMDQRTPDLSPIIQEIVNRPGWARKSLALIITGTGHRTAVSFDGSPTACPKLHIEVACGGANHAPEVNAGPDQTITFPASAPLAEVITDDGLPDPPGEVSDTWSKVSGPGTVTITNTAQLFRVASPMHDVQQQASFSAPGTYVLRLTAFDGELTASDDVTIVVLPASSGLLDRPIAAGSDDAEEDGPGVVNLVSTDLDIGQLKLGLRFTGIDIPRGSTITNAWVQFQTDEANSDVTNATIQAQAADSVFTFTTATKDVTLRPRTTASVAWAPVAWTVVGEAGANQRTPNIASVIQEVVNRAGWARRSLAIIMTGTGHRTGVSFEVSPAASPKLHVEFTPPPAAEAGAEPAPAVEPADAQPAIAFTRLGTVFPNPGSGHVTVRFELARPSEVQLELYDVRGALVRRVAEGMRPPGTYSEAWDGHDRNGNAVPSGVYLLRFIAGTHRESRRLVVLHDGRSGR